MMYGYWVSQSIYVAAKLKLADQLVGGPVSTDDLANTVQANENNLYRLLRGLASVGVFEELDNRTFQLTPMSEQLRSDVDGSQWAGNGTLLSAVLRRNPALKGILFELPHVLDRAKKNFEKNGVADRSQAISGSFLDEIPTGADTIMMRHVIHNWDQAEAIKILKNFWRSPPAKRELLILETIIPTGSDGPFAKLRDLSMMLLVGGEERTEVEYREILEAAGLLRLFQPKPAEAS